MTVEIEIPVSIVWNFLSIVPGWAWATIACLFIGTLFIIVGWKAGVAPMVAAGAGLFVFGGFILATSVTTVVLATAPPAWEGALNWTWPISVKVV